MAIIVQREGKTLEIADIRSFCEGELASYKIPHQLGFFDELPRSLQGKVLKFQLRKQFMDQVSEREV